MLLEHLIFVFTSVGIEQVYGLYQTSSINFPYGINDRVSYVTRSNRLIIKNNATAFFFFSYGPLVLGHRFE